MSVVSNIKKKKKGGYGKIITYHARESFCMKEDFTPPKSSQLHHIFGEQESLFQRRGNVTTYTPVEVPDWCIIHQGFTTKYGSWKPCLGLWELNIFLLRSLAGGMASFLLLWRPVRLFFIKGTSSSCLHCLLTLWLLSPLRVKLFGPRGRRWLRSTKRRLGWRRRKLSLRRLPSFSPPWLAL